MNGCKAVSLLEVEVRKALPDDQRFGWCGHERIVARLAGSGRIRRMSSVYEQQPLQRIIGRRQSRDGRLLTAGDRALMARNARYVTRAPKGVIFYGSHEEMDADRQRWLVGAMVERAR